MVEEGEVCSRYGAVPLRQGFERRIEAGAQVEPASDVAKLDDLATHRERRHELRALHRLGRVRYTERRPYMRPSQSSGVRGIGPVARLRKARRVRAGSRPVRNAGDSGGNKRNERAAAPAPATSANAAL
jgi:hypothetical protein